MKMFISAALALSLYPVSLLAQVAAPSATDTTTGILTLVAQLGLSAVFLWQWQSERKERAAAQERLSQFLERFAPTLADAIKVLGDVKAGLQSTVERVQVVPDRADYDLALRRLELATSEITDLIDHEKGRP